MGAGRNDMSRKRDAFMWLTKYVSSVLELLCHLIFSPASEEISKHSLRNSGLRFPNFPEGQYTTDLNFQYRSSRGSGFVIRRIREESNKMFDYQILGCVSAECFFFYYTGRWRKISRS